MSEEEQTPVVAEEETKEEETVADETPAEETPAVEEQPEAEPESEDEEIEYTCPEEFDEREEMRKMFVGGLDKNTADDEFKKLFEKYGNITDFIIIRKDNNKSDRLFGFITFEKCDDLENCLLDRPHKYKEKELDVKRAVPKGNDDGNGHYKVKKLHVANISAELTVKDLKTYLRTRHPSQFGKIEEINFLKQKDEEGKPTDKNRGFGFVTVTTEDFADRISIAESKFILLGQNMRISKAKPRNADGGAGGGRGGFRAKQGGYGQNQGGWGEDWSGGYGGGYGGYGGYGGGYGQGYGAGYGGYDYYGGYGGGYGGYPQRSGGRGGGGARFQPY